MGSYCVLCHNEPVEGDDPCVLCQKHVVNGPLAEAYQRWSALRQERSVCCSGLSYWFGRGVDPSSREQGQLYFHGKYWEGSHNGTFVEYGVSFYKKGARTYFLRDFDSTADSEEYGEQIPYTNQEFWTLLEAQLDKAPKEAWDSGLCTCEKCGYHYYESCGCDEDAPEAETP